MQRQPREITGKPQTNYKTDYERIPGTHLPRIPKGTRLGGGRKKGQESWLTATIKEATSAGAAACGYDGKGKDGLEGYMRRLAEKEPVAFTTLLKAIIPLQLQAHVAVNGMGDNADEVLSIEELEARLHERGLRPMIDVTPLPKIVEGAKK